MAKFFSKPVAVEAWRVPAPDEAPDEPPPPWLVHEIALGGAKTRPAGGIDLATSFVPVGAWVVLEADRRLRGWNAYDFAKCFTAADGIVDEVYVFGDGLDDEEVTDGVRSPDGSRDAEG